MNTIAGVVSKRLEVSPQVFMPKFMHNKRDKYLMDTLQNNQLSKKGKEKVVQAMLDNGESIGAMRDKPFNLEVNMRNIHQWNEITTAKYFQMFPEKFSYNTLLPDNTNVTPTSFKAYLTFLWMQFARDADLFEFDVFDFPLFDENMEVAIPVNVAVLMQQFRTGYLEGYYEINPVFDFKDWAITTDGIFGEDYNPNDLSSPASPLYAGTLNEFKGIYPLEFKEFDPLGTLDFNEYVLTTSSIGQPSTFYAFCRSLLTTDPNGSTFEISRYNNIVTRLPTVDYKNVRAKETTENGFITGKRDPFNANNITNFTNVESCKNLWQCCSYYNSNDVTSTAGTATPLRQRGIVNYGPYGPQAELAIPFEGAIQETFHLIYENANFIKEKIENGHTIKDKDFLLIDVPPNNMEPSAKNRKKKVNPTMIHRVVTPVMMQEFIGAYVSEATTQLLRSQEPNSAQFNSVKYQKALSLHAEAWVINKIRTTTPTGLMFRPSVAVAGVYLGGVAEHILVSLFRRFFSKVVDANAPGGDAVIIYPYINPIAIAPYKSSLASRTIASDYSQWNVGRIFVDYVNSSLSCCEVLSDFPVREDSTHAFSVPSSEVPSKGNFLRSLSSKDNQQGKTKRKISRSDCLSASRDLIGRGKKIDFSKISLLELKDPKRELSHFYGSEASQLEQLEDQRRYHEIRLDQSEVGEDPSGEYLTCNKFGSPERLTLNLNWFDAYDAWMATDGVIPVFIPLGTLGFMDYVIEVEAGLSMASNMTTSTSRDRTISGSPSLRTQVGVRADTFSEIVTEESFPGIFKLDTTPSVISSVRQIAGSAYELSRNASIVADFVIGDEDNEPASQNGYFIDQPSFVDGSPWTPANIAAYIVQQNSTFKDDTAAIHENLHGRFAFQNLFGLIHQDEEDCKVLALIGNLVKKTATAVASIGAGLVNPNIGTISSAAKSTLVAVDAGVDLVTGLYDVAQELDRSKKKKENPSQVANTLRLAHQSVIDAKKRKKANNQSNKKKDMKKERKKVSKAKGRK